MQRLAKDPKPIPHITNLVLKYRYWVSQYWNSQLIIALIAYVLVPWAGGLHISSDTLRCDVLCRFYYYCELNRLAFYVYNKIWCINVKL